MPPSPDAINTPQIIGWSVTAAVLAGNLLWNWLNRRHSNSLASGIRQDTFKLDQWTGLKSSVEGALDSFEEQVDIILMLVAPSPEAKDPEPFAKTIGLKGKALALKQDKLARSLAACDRSLYAEGCSWEVLANGRTQNYESDWDNINNILIEAAEQPDGKAIETLKDIGPYARSIAVGIQDALRVETVRHDPDRI